MRKGIAVSPGVIIGTAYCIHDVFVDPEREHIESNEVGGHIAKFDNARQKSIDEVRLLQAKVEQQIGKEAARIFAVHETILNDPALIQKVCSYIQNDLLSAQAALARTLEHYRKLFSATSDEYFKERMADIRDVIDRLTSHLSDALHSESKVLTGAIIVVAEELLPSHVVMLGEKTVHGIVTQAGGQTSHAAIIARSRGIPAVSGVTGILSQAKTGDQLIVDGRDGLVIVNPEPETLAAYRKLEREFFDLRDKLAHNRDHAAVTRDQVGIELLANINSLTDAHSAIAMGAGGVGLYRTEFLYLTHPNVPDEEEQLAIYNEIIEASPNRNVTIRTLDIGGDKTSPFLGRSQHEANPFMGWRSIRLSFEHPQFFTAQIRAILRSAAPTDKARQVKIMFPMVTNYEELRRLRVFVRYAASQLQREHKPFGRVDFGMMLEVPAAAVMLDQMLELVDFVSIGSNDLVQYLMAADRDNPKVSHLCQPLSPAVLRVLQSVVQLCNQHKKAVTLCGEMAGQPQAFVLLLGMGLRRFSMSPAFVPTIKELATSVSISEAEDLLARALRLKTTKKIRKMMNSELASLAPSLAPILMQ